MAPLNSLPSCWRLVRGNLQGWGLDSLWRKRIRPRPLYSLTETEKIRILIGMKTDGAAYDLIQTAKKQQEFVCLERRAKSKNDARPGCSMLSCSS